MKERNFIESSVRGLVCILALAASSVAFGQQDDRAADLQSSALARIAKWRDYVRSTGDARSTASELESAQAELIAAYNGFLKVNDYANAAWSAINLGDILRYVNQWANAIPIYKQAEELAQKARRSDYQTKALARLAYSEMSVNQMDAAAEHAQQAVRLGAGCGNPDFYFDALLTAEEVDIKRGDLAAASDYVDRALSLTSQLHDKRQTYVVYGDRADVYYQKAIGFDCQKQPDVCLQAYERAKSDYQAAQSAAQESGYAFIAQNYAQLIQGAQGQITILKGKVNNTLAIPSAMFEPKQPKDVLANEIFATGAASSENVVLVQSAVAEMDNYKASLRRQGLAVQDLNPDDDFVHGQLAEMNGDDQAALTDYGQAIQLLEQDRRNLNDENARSRFMEDKLDYYYRPALLLLQQKQYSQAFSLFEQSRSRAIADMLFSHQLTLGTAQERDLFSRLQTQRVAIASKQQELFALTSSANREQNGKKIGDLEHEIEGMQQRYQQLEASISSQAPRLRQLTHADVVTLESVKDAAAQGEYDVLYYVAVENQIILWHLNGSEVQVRNVFLPRAELIKKTSALRDSLESGPDAPFDEEHARQLYLFLVQPMAAYIRTRHLVIIPHEELNSIPFQVLLDPGTGKYTGETYAISYAPSATVLQDLVQSDALQRGKLLAVADPGLAAALDEVNAIGKLYPNRSKVVQAATKDDLKSLAGGYDVVHLSMHGEFNEREPMLSYLQLKASPPDDGRLTAAEMFGLPLKKNAIAVLSACETGRVKAGHSNEVEGIVRALLYAGAGTLVLSDWKVDAAATSVWMQTFYREGQSRSPAEAARLALVAVKSRPNYSHPYFWAPFLLTGK